MSSIPLLHRVAAVALLSAVAVLTCGRGTASESRADAARVVGIFPSVDRLPANQLKLYIEFSAPMTTRTPYDYLRLVDEETGESREAVFHAMRDGLWDPQGRRLTVLFDPGRIKRGLANHDAFGPPLAPGRAYRLEVSRDWPDTYGRPLGAGRIKRFEVIEADRRRPAVAGWTVEPPSAGSRESLRVGFDEPLDAALLPRAFRLVDPSGAELEVEVRPGPLEQSVELLPTRAWSAGRHRLEVDPRLEDLAGNNLARLFDTDLTAPPETSIVTRVAFDIQPSVHPHLR